MADQEAKPRGKSVANPELKAMATIDETLTALGDDDAVGRVLDWVNAAHGYYGGEPSPQPAVARMPGQPDRQLDGQHAETTP